MVLDTDDSIYTALFFFEHSHRPNRVYIPAFLFGYALLIPLFQQLVPLLDTCPKLSPGCPRLLSTCESTVHLFNKVTSNSASIIAVLNVVLSVRLSLSKRHILLKSTNWLSSSPTLTRTNCLSSCQFQGHLMGTFTVQIKAVTMLTQMGNDSLVIGHLPTKPHLPLQLHQLPPLVHHHHYLLLPLRPQAFHLPLRHSTFHLPLSHWTFHLLLSHDHTHLITWILTTTIQIMSQMPWILML